MAMQVQEVFRPKPMTESGTLAGPNGNIGGFLCTTAGTLSITEGTASGGDTIVDQITMVAGTWYPLPFKFPSGAYAVLGGGAEGTFGV